MENIITVHFAAGQTQAVAPGALYQWAYGQTLKIEGLQLPTAYQVDFSNFEFCGSSIPRIGGADGVTVPAEVLATGQPVFAFIWLQNQNAGRTWYRIMIRVIPRPAPDPDEPNPEEESAIAEAIAALNAGVTAAETAQEKAEDAQDAAEAAQEAAEDAAELLEHPGAEAHTLSAGSSATASYENGIFSFGIPKGDKGDTGATGPQGPIGLTPALSIGTVNTLAAGSPATASFTGTDAAPVLNLGIPKGADGDVSSASIAPTFSPSTAYSAGDYVWYSGALYRFTAAHAAGAWSGSDAVAVQLAEDVGDLKSALSNLETRLKSGDEEDADLHLGFYLDENGDLCQVDDE